MNTFDPVEHNAAWAAITFAVDGILGMGLALALSGVLGMKGLGVATKRFILFIGLGAFTVYILTIGNPSSDYRLENVLEHQSQQAVADADSTQSKLNNLRRRIVDAFTKKDHK